MEKERPTISFIIVNFNSREFLPRCLASVAKMAGLNKEIILVNNDSEALDPPENLGCPLKLIQAQDNAGFGSGINLGARSADGQFLFFLNPDAEIETAPFQRAIQAFKHDPQLAILGAKIIDARGDVQDWIAGGAVTPWRILKNKLGLDQNQKINRQKNALAVDWVSGGAMLIRKDVFRKLGGFDEKMFLYFEDVDLCRRARKAGFDILYFPELVVRHLGGQSFADRKTQKKYYYQSQEYYLQKHFGKINAWIIKRLRIIFYPFLKAKS